MDKLVPDEVVLGLLKAQPAHGYELLEIFRSRSQLGRIWTMSTSQLYAVLKRLEREGLILGQEIAAVNAPPRIVYEVTSLGEKRLNAWLFDCSPSPSIHRIRVLFLSRIYIANLLGILFGEIIKAQIVSCIDQRDHFIGRITKNGSQVEKLTINFVVGQLDAAIQWLQESDFQLNLHDEMNIRKE